MHRKGIPKALVFLYGSLLGGFALLSYYAHQLPYFPGDLEITLWVQSIHLPLFDLAMRTVTAVGFETPVLIAAILGAGILWLLQKRLEGTFLLLAILPDLFNRILKQIIGRPRPTEELVQVLEMSQGASFPSSHALHSVVFYGFLFYLASTSLRKGWAKRIIQASLALLIPLTGLSRVYMGAHWPSDVAGSYLLGVLFLSLLVAGYRRLARN